MVCFGYTPGPLQIAGHVASVTFYMKRCRWGSTLLEKHGEAEGGRRQSAAQRRGHVCGPYVCMDL